MTYVIFIFSDELNLCSFASINIVNVYQQKIEELTYFTKKTYCLERGTSFGDRPLAIDASRTKIRTNGKSNTSAQIPKFQVQAPLVKGQEVFIYQV